MHQSQVHPTTIDQCQRWLTMLTQHSADGEWTHIESIFRAFTGFSRTVGGDLGASSIVVGLLQQKGTSFEFSRVLEIIDRVVGKSTSSPEAHRCVFRPGLPELEERVSTLVRYLRHPYEFSQSGMHAEHVGLRTRECLQELVSGSVDFQNPVAEAAILYLFGTALVNSPPASLYELLKHPNQIPFTVSILGDCGESVLNFLRLRRAKTTGTERTKSDKFGILDTPSLLTTDLAASPGVLGTACIYLDIDNFKPLNTRWSERVVDLALLTPFQRFLTNCISGLGYAYAEGGDEITMLLPNATLDMAVAFTKAVRQALETRVFPIGNDAIRLTISAGIAHAEPGSDRSCLPNKANSAMRAAKDRGKNRFFVHKSDGPRNCENVLPGGHPAVANPATHPAEAAAIGGM